MSYGLTSERAYYFSTPPKRGVYYSLGAAPIMAALRTIMGGMTSKHPRAPLAQVHRVTRTTDYTQWFARMLVDRYAWL